MLLVLAAVLFVSGLTLNHALSRARTYPGRENAQGRNCQMIKRLCVSQEVDDFLSTRVTYWDLAEKSPTRLAFRSLITEKINAGFLVKRIWHVASVDDVERLRRYLADYVSHDNYQVRILTDLAYPIPELLCVGMKFASITFPEVKSPRRMSVTVQFRRAPEVEAIRKYYGLLWELAEPIKNGPQINLSRLDELLREFRRQE